MSDAPTLPYTLTFTPVPGTDLPGMHSYAWLVAPDRTWWVLGGRLNGLHKFGPPPSNFDGPNTKVWQIDPSAGTATERLDLTTLPPEIGDPLMSANQPAYYDRSTGEWLIVGGYGTDSATGQDRTFDTLIRIPVADFTTVLQSSSSPAQKATAVAAMAVVEHDPFFQVAGAGLRRIGDRYAIMFGQGFNGDYAPFSGSADQHYTEAVRVFRLRPGGRGSFAKGELRTAEADQPFHRRDGVVVDTVDPRTGLPRLAAFGGVFPPGKLDGYLNPVYLDERNGQLITKTDRSVKQLFNQYQCPTIAIWNPTESSIYHTFYGGISRYWYHQTSAQAQVYEEVTANGRNDGLPFVSDITTLITTPTGSSQWIAPTPVPGGVLTGTAVDFIPDTSDRSGATADTGVVDLSKVPSGATIRIGHLYGGILAQFPLPLQPSHGTVADTSLIAVNLTRTASPAGLPASAGNRADGVLRPPINR